MNRRARIQIFVTGVIWSSLSALSFLYFHSPRRGWVFAGLAAFFILSATLAPPVARAIHKILSTLVQALASGVTWTLLSIVYFLFLSPLGLVLRMTGSLKTARNADQVLESYWVDRPPEPLDPARYLRPF